VRERPRCSRPAQGDEPQRPADVVVAGGVVIALDGREDEPIDALDVSERGGDLLRMREIECQRLHLAGDALRDLGRSCRVAPGDDDVTVPRGVRLGQPQADPEVAPRMTMLPWLTSGDEPPLTRARAASERTALRTRASRSR
jgi:hypothetical protein